MAALARAMAAACASHEQSVLVRAGRRTLKLLRVTARPPQQAPAARCHIGGQRRGGRDPRRLIHRRGDNLAIQIAGSSAWQRGHRASACTACCSLSKLCMGSRCAPRFCYIAHADWRTCATTCLQEAHDRHVACLRACVPAPACACECGAADPGAHPWPPLPTAELPHSHA